MPQSECIGQGETEPMTQCESDRQDNDMAPNESAVMAPNDTPAIPMEKVPDTDVEAGKERKEAEFCGLSKEELMQYANDPFWVRLRWALFIAFWLIWLAMLVGAVIIIVLGPKCAQKSQLQWWQKEAIYQIHVRSFKDSDGDGIGDIPGIISKLDYLQSLDVRAVALSSMLMSPSDHFDYDINDFEAVDPQFGTLNDFDRLVGEMKQREMRLIIEFVPNHSGLLHEWFDQSVARAPIYQDFYVWADNDTDGGPPNDWRSKWGGSAWTYNQRRGQFYYHQFLPKQPDLNYRSSHVVEEVAAQLRFWLERGVDGVRLSGVRHLLETDDLTALEPYIGDSAVSDGEESWRTRDHTGVTMDVTGSEQVVEQLRTLVAKYPGVVLLADVNDGSETVRRRFQSGSGTHAKAHLAVWSQLAVSLSTPDRLTPAVIEQTVAATAAAASVDDTASWPSWMVGGFDVPRLATRVGGGGVDLVHALALCLPGVPLLYYGDELGIPALQMSFADTLDPRGQACGVSQYSSCSRDPQRTPMPWTSQLPSVGFTTAVRPWLPVKSPEAAVSVEETEPQSHLAVVRRLIELRRRHTALTDGDFTTLLVNNQIFSFVRRMPDDSGCVILLNTADSAVPVVDLTADGLPVKLPATAELLLRSSQLSEPLETVVQLNAVSLLAKEAMVLRIEAPQ